jgi:hypothetical protein
LPEGIVKKLSPIAILIVVMLIVAMAFLAACGEPKDSDKMIGSGALTAVQHYSGSWSQSEGWQLTFSDGRSLQVERYLGDQSVEMYQKGFFIGKKYNIFLTDNSKYPEAYVKLAQ